MADSRFSALSTDPRYRLPSRKESRTAVDPRFKRLFTDQDFRKKASVDRYGRRVKPESGKKDLERLYRLDKPEKSLGAVHEKEKEVLTSSEEGSPEEASEDEQLVGKRDPAREGGFSESSSDVESGSEEESEDEVELAEETAGQEQTEEIPMGEISRRIAAVNLDWDNIRATDIMAVASSFVPVDARIASVTIYPSEFGRERMEREELEGPPREIFASSKRRLDDDGGEQSSDGDDEEVDEKIKRQLQEDQVDEGEEFDTAKLRQYQLERLRYYYAVISCDSKSTGKALYDAMDGREYLTTSNFFDLRFIPDDTSFEDDKPTDECSSLPLGYKPNDFRTEALTHSKVRLTWDDDDATRKDVQKRAFSRAEIDENDLQAYIGSESSDAESVASRKSAAEDRREKRKVAEKAKMRAALGLAEEPIESKAKAVKSSQKASNEKDIVGDMQITFTSGLTSGSGGQGVFENEPQDEQSTRDRYIRKERERKQKRKERMKAGLSSANADADTAAGGEMDEAQDQGFDDPFFTDPSASAATEKKARKADQQKKRAEQLARDEEASTRKAELELLMADDQADNLKHFDIRDVQKAEKEAKRKGKKGKSKKGRDVGDVKDTFQVEAEDPRFRALFESHEYAIDPTNPRFKGTHGMQALLEEGRKRKRNDLEDDDEPHRIEKKLISSDTKGDNELKGLVARLQDGRKAKGR